MNNHFRKVQQEWFDTNYQRLFRFKEEIFTNAFFYAEPEDISIPKVMVIGQEPLDFNEYMAPPNLQEEQEWTVKYLQRQAYGVENDIRYNQSPFWELFRKIRNAGLNPTWNNIDKAHRLVEGKTKPLHIENECVLNAPLESNGKSLLQNEIMISKPDIVLFITGPDYWISMQTSLQCNGEKLKDNKPNTSAFIRDITDIAKISVPCLWTYHPGFFRKTGRNEYLQIIAERVKGEL